jgi:ABC-2 type transport system ATP-binding protein
MLKLEKINKSFWKKQILFDLNTTINKWEIVGILWPNWAWKSTTMKILTAFYLPDSWDVTINWESIFKNNNLKQKIWYLPEINPLYEDMWVDEFLNFTADLKQVKDKEKEIDKVLKMTWLQEKKLKFINTLSKWYKQRVGLASALIWDPEILILDEPTEWLDPNQRDEIKTLIKQLWKTKTILISSHVLTELSDLVNRVIIISDWKIKLDDTVENIETSNNWKSNIIIQYEWKIKIKKLKEKYSEIENIEEEKNKLIITLNKDIRRKLIQDLVSNYDILEFYSKKINLSDVFFENIK